MTALLVALLAAFRSSVRSRLELQVEILDLRHQLAVLQRQPSCPRLGRTDRLLWVLLSRLWPNWRRAVQIVTPDTVVRWHRRGFALYWSWKSRPRAAGRPPVAVDIRALIQQMQAANLGRAAHPRRTPEAGRDARCGRTARSSHTKLAKQPNLAYMSAKVLEEFEEAVAEA